MIIKNREEKKEVKIKVYKLTGCGFCEALMSRLQQEQITFTPIDVNDVSVIADVERLEQFFESNRYPKIVAIQGNKSYFINPDEGKRVAPLTDTHEFHYYRQIDEVVQIIKSIKNEI